MATKNGLTDDKKRKAASSTSKNRGDVKKARHMKADAKPKKVVDEDVASDSSDDSDDGGASLEERSHKFNDKKGDARPKDKAFERSEGETSRESHAKQKKLAQERKAAKPLADEVQRSKKIWERLRRKSHVPKEERKQLVEELFTIITGRMRDFVLKHDAVRAVQTGIKYGTPEQKRMIAHELKGTFPQLAESRYAKFLVAKLMIGKNGEVDRESRDLIVPEFYGRVRKLINHPEASWILDDIYRQVATKEQKAVLLREWFGPEFALQEMIRDAEPTADLKEILQNEPAKRGPIMKSLLDMINSLVQKKMTGFTMLHDAMLQYFLALEVGSEDFLEFFELVKGDEGGDLLKNLAFTPNGARLVCYLLAHGSAKDRKTLLKVYKDTFLMMSADPHAHAVILTAYDVIDDTKLTSKTIFPELLGENADAVAQNIVATANNADARKTILYLTEGLSRSLFPAKNSFDCEVLEQVHEIRKLTSKKDEDVRRKELLASVAPPVFEAIAAAAADLVVTPFGCQFVNDILLFGIGDKTAALEALAACARGDPNQDTTIDELVPAPPHVSQTPFGGRMLKSLIQGGRYDKAAGKVVAVDPPLHFANILYPAIQDHVTAWATSPSSFVILGMLEAPDFAHAAELRKTLKKDRKALEKAATEETPEQKAARELAASEDKPAKVAKAAKGKKATQKSVGNMGSKLLLEKL